MKDILIVIVSAILLSFVAFAVALLWKVPLHNANLRAFERSFAIVAHPEKSQLLVALTDFGGFGNSNHCDYFVGEFRSSSLPHDDIVRHYAGMTIKSPDITQHAWDGEPPMESDVEVYFTDTDRDLFEWYPWSEWLAQAPQQPKEHNGTTYLVFALEDGYPPLGDYRCH